MVFFPVYRSLDCAIDIVFKVSGMQLSGKFEVGITQTHENCEQLRPSANAQYLLRLTATRKISGK